MMVMQLFEWKMSTVFFCILYSCIKCCVQDCAVISPEICANYVEVTTSEWYCQC